MKNKCLVLAIVLAGILSLSVLVPVVSAADKVTIELWVLNDQDKMYEPLIRDFVAENPNIEIKISTRTTDGHKEGLKVAASSNTLPNLWFNWGGSLGSFYPENGLTLDLTEYAEKGNWDEKYLEAGIELTKFDGQISGVPIKLASLGLFYRKDIFNDLGLQVPTTFAELENVMETLKANGITPISLGGRFGWMTMRFTEAILEHFAGPELKDRLISLEESWDNPAVVQTYAKLKEWVDKEYFPPGFIVEDPSEVKIPLYRGTAAMVFEGPWFDTTMLNDEFDNSIVGFFPFPTDHTPMRVSSFVEMLQIRKDAPPEELEAAVQFALFATSKEMVEKYPEYYHWIVPVIGVEPPSELPNVPDMIAAMNGGTYVITDQALDQEMVSKFFEAQDNVVLGVFTPEEAAKFLENAAEMYR